MLQRSLATAFTAYAAVQIHFNAIPRNGYDLNVRSHWRYAYARKTMTTPHEHYVVHVNASQRFCWNDFEYAVQFHSEWKLVLK